MNILKLIMDLELVKILKSNKKLHFILRENIESFKIHDNIKSKNLNLLQKLILKSNHTKIKDYIKNNIHKYEDQKNYQNDVGFTALMMACSNSETYSNNEIVEFLLKNNADPNLQDKKGITALMYSCVFLNKNSSIKTIKLLLANGSDINKS